MLNLKRYGWLCVLGGEVLYALCLIGGIFPWRTARGVEVHEAIFETLPGFTWLTGGSIVLGAVYVFVFAWVLAWYYVWMHNSSIANTSK
ncbi:MAG: hypothetical protein HYW65_01085 [Candidatus Liptonbacteria bacterium]|nr:hypothetical protein [Candidatus Liptonbacteria bacterium]